MDLYSDISLMQEIKRSDEETYNFVVKILSFFTHADKIIVGNQLFTESTSNGTIN